MDDETPQIQVQLQRLPEQIKQFYGVYFTALRRVLRRGDLFSEAVPDFLKGYKRVLTMGATDGVVSAHFPIEREFTVNEKNTGKVMLTFPAKPGATHDVYEFVQPFTNFSAREIAEMLSEEEDIGLEIAHGKSWGAIGFASPQQKVDVTTGELAWQAPWTRLVCANFNSLHYWENPEQAKAEAWKDIRHYVHSPDYQSETPLYRELDEVEAPETIEGVSVEAGDPGVVVEVFERPSPALLVEYADAVGQTKALVTYSADLGRVIDVLDTREEPVDTSEEVSPGRKPVLGAQVFAQPLAS